MQFLGKGISYNFLAISEKHPTDFHSTRNGKWFNPHIVLRVGLHDYLWNIAPLFAPNWFVDALSDLFGFQGFFSTQ